MMLPVNSNNGSSGSGSNFNYKCELFVTQLLSQQQPQQPQSSSSDPNTTVLPGDLVALAHEIVTEKKLQVKAINQKQANDTSSVQEQLFNNNNSNNNNSTLKQNKKIKMARYEWQHLVNFLQDCEGFEHLNNIQVTHQRINQLRLELLQVDPPVIDKQQEQVTVVKKKKKNVKEGANSSIIKDKEQYERVKTAMLLVVDKLAALYLLFHQAEQVHDASTKTIGQDDGAMIRNMANTYYYYNTGKKKQQQQQYNNEKKKKTSSSTSSTMSIEELLSTLLVDLIADKYNNNDEVEAE